MSNCMTFNLHVSYKTWNRVNFSLNLRFLILYSSSSYAIISIFFHECESLHIYPLK